MLHGHTVCVLRIAQVADALNLSRATIYRLIEGGELVRVKIGARAVGVTTDSLQEFVSRKIQESKSDIDQGH